MNEAIITYFGRKARVICDRQCHKAWGINSRPRVNHDTHPNEFADDDDDYAYLADDELGIAPVNPGTYEGGHGKPLSPDEFPNKWCVRECERSDMTAYGQSIDEPLELTDFTKRHYNMPWLHTQEGRNE